MPDEDHIHPGDEPVTGGQRPRSADSRTNAAIADLVSVAAAGCAMSIGGFAREVSRGTGNKPASDRRHIEWSSTTGSDRRRFDFDASLAGRVLTSGVPLIVDDLSLDSALSTCAPVAEAPYLRGYAGVPVTGPDGQAIGVLFVADPEPRTIDADRARMLEGIARRIAVEIQGTHTAAAAKSAFLANMSHEIRTPLTAILGFTEALAEDLSDRELKAILRSIRRNGRHLVSIFDDILDLATLEGGQAAAKPIPFDPAALIEETQRLFEVRAESEGLRLVVDWDSDIPDIIVADPVPLRKILTNLLDNAIRFTEHGRVEVRIEHRPGILAPPSDAEESASPCADATVPVVEAGGTAGILSVTVRDTGIGMEAAILASLFQPFSQADDSMTRRHGGAGLGLAVSQRLARLLGGGIHATSRVGHGSEFVLQVPSPVPGGIGRHDVHFIDRGDDDGNLGVMRSAPAGGASSGRAPVPADSVAVQRLDAAASFVGLGGVASAGRHTPVPGHAPPSSLDQPVDHRPLENWRILYVEDGPDNRRLVAFNLRRAGAEVSLATNGAEGIEAVQRATQLGRPFDLIIMDMQMPVVDGYTATLRLRTEGCVAPILALTAHAMAGDRKRCLEAGCDGYASKPIDRRRLVELCLRLADRRRSDAA